jgi:hypothetical protein
MNNLTPASLSLFIALADDAGNWSGTPMIDVTPAERGNLTDLKTKGLLTTGEDEGVMFAWFTDAGKALASEHGIDLSWVDY